MILALGAGNTLAFYGAARRYVVGKDGPYGTSDPAWSSNLGFVPAVVLYRIALTVFLVALRRQRNATDLPVGSASEEGEVSASIKSSGARKSPLLDRRQWGLG